MKRITLLLTSLFIAVTLSSQTRDNLLNNLIQKQDYVSGRVSSFDRGGGNADAMPIGAGETKTIAEIQGPGIIHHIWVTINAEEFYGKKIVLRMYWDDEKEPSVEAPIGDFFGVGHGLNRNYASLPFVCTSEGRARNCYWLMPFNKSARIEVTNEGSSRVNAFYYYVDYRQVEELPADTRYFHAQYHQEFPPEPIVSSLGWGESNLDGKENYLFLDAKGEGHYVGVSYSILNRSPGWWGEGDDFIWIDGEETPSLMGTGSEDYFCDAWGMRESESLFYGCPLQEHGYDPGDKATVYRFHINDPIPFTKSIKVSIEHGHANARSDYLSSVAYWYQAEPHKPFPTLPSVKNRLPFAVESDRNSFPFTGLEISEHSEGVQTSMDSMLYYDSQGTTLRQLKVEFTGTGDEIAFQVNVPAMDKYRVTAAITKGMNHAKVSLGFGDAKEVIVDGYSDAEVKITDVSLGEFVLEGGNQLFTVRCEGNNPASSGMGAGLVSVKLEPVKSFIGEWSVIGSFDNPEDNIERRGLEKVYPPEREINLKKSYTGKNHTLVKWQTVIADSDGLVNLDPVFVPNNDKAVAYALTYVWSPDNRDITIYIGSDDGCRVWINDELIHHKLLNRPAIADDDNVDCALKKGWNKLLVKIEDNTGGWGFYFRIPDVDNQLKFSPNKN